MSDDLLKQAARIIANAEHIVCFTGAGISTESGIPDFRSADGLWSRYDPSEYATLSGFIARPEKYWTMHREVHRDFKDVQPNAAHYALVELEKCGKLHVVITQNIDNLHQAAGTQIPVLEVHGNYRRGYCFRCRKSVPFEDYDKQLQEGIFPPHCSECGPKGVIKPDVILFEELPPIDVLETANIEASRCDVMLIVGSSLTVVPAAFIPLTARQSGAELILVNQEPTEMDLHMAVRLLGSAGTILPKLAQEVTRILSEKKK